MQVRSKGKKNNAKKYRRKNSIAAKEMEITATNVSFSAMHFCSYPYQTYIFENQVKIPNTCFHHGDSVPEVVSWSCQDGTRVFLPGFFHGQRSRRNILSVNTIPLRFPLIYTAILTRLA